MNELRENLIDRMIKIYGFENPIVIRFCDLCENYGEGDWNDKILTLLVEAHETKPYNPEDEE